MSKFFAGDGVISRAPIAGGIEITEAEYSAALDGILAGQIVTVADGALAVCDPPKPREPELPPEPTAAEKLRWERNARLYEALAVLDRHRNQAGFGLPTTLTAEQATAWAVYAQELRDLPATTVDPANPVWPEAPGAES
ncbi:MAG: phage tail assembly chaperone [Rhodospirillaceae bacterium]|nr:phage tail assembly chaperone [Rhodospirillaceae bacterium]